MFQYLYDVIFPVLGEFFGKISALASAPTGEVFSVLSAMVLPNKFSNGLEFTNLFTGVTDVFLKDGLFNVISDSSFLLSFISSIGGWVLSLVGSVIHFLGFYNIPFSLGLVLLFVEFLAVFYLIRFIRNIFI